MTDICGAPLNVGDKVSITYFSESSYLGGFFMSDRLIPGIPGSPLLRARLILESSPTSKNFPVAHNSPLK